MTSEEQFILTAIINPVVDEVFKYDPSFTLLGYIVTPESGSHKGQQMIYFKPSEYSDRIEVEGESFVVSLILNEVIQAEALGEEAYKNKLLEIRNELVRDILYNYYPRLKEQIQSLGLSPTNPEEQDIKPYHERFDFELIEAVKYIYNDVLKTEINTIYSEKIDLNAFKVVSETSDGIVLKLFYLRAPDKGVPQLQLDSIFVPEGFRGLGISKIIINHFLLFCTDIVKADFFLIHVINEDWEFYLRTKGALLIQKDKKYGDIL